MKTKIILAFVFCFFVAAATAQAAVLANFEPDGTSTFTIKPDQIFTIGDTAYLSLHIVSNNGPINFTANVSLLEGTSTLADFNIVSITGSCTLFSCTYDGLWPFTVNSIPVTYQVVVTDTDNNVTITKNASTSDDDDGDGYYSIATGGNDCDDTNPAVNPGIAEVCGDGLDNDCSAGDAVCPGPPPDNGGGSSSGGSSSTGGGSGSLISDTVTCLDGKVTIAPNDKVVIKYGGKNYTLFVKDIISNAVMFKIYPIPSRDIQIKEDSTKMIDLDWDNDNDLKVKISDIESNVAAKISCSYDSSNKVVKEEEVEEKPVLSNIKEGILNIASEIVPKDKASPIVGSVLALVIIVIGLLGYSLYKRRKQDEDEFGF